MLITDRFHLNAATPQDTAAMVRYYRVNWDHLRPWEPQRRADPRQFAYWQAQLRQQEADHVAQNGLMLLVRTKEQADNQADILGVIRFSQVARGPFQACYLGFSLTQTAIGHGVMQEALTVAIDHMFDDWRLHRIMANYLPRNRRSGALLERLGFVREGLATDYLQINGIWEDHVLMAKTNTKLAPAIA
jgi:ribosomal-protein-alanine N-acetyltransferase